MLVEISNPTILAKILFYAVTNNMQFGNKAKVNDAVNFAMNMGIDKITQDKLGLTEILNTLNFSK